MSDEVVRRAAQFVFAAMPAEQTEVIFLWHAGEPLAARMDFYRRAFSIIETEAGSRIHVRFSFQTNATLVNDKWCRFFANHDVTLGVSIDGPRHIHDSSRVSWGGTGSFDRTMRGISVLRAHGYNPPAICVLTPRSLDQPDAIYEFFLENRFPSVGFNVEESEGVYTRSRHLDASQSDVRWAYFRFMRRIWQRRLKDGNRLRVREFERELAMIEDIRRDPTFVATPDEVRLFANITIRRDGSISTFAPELASTPSVEYGDFTVGNVLNDTPLTVRAGTAVARLQRDIQAGRDACKATCPYYPLCGAGYQSNRYAERKSLMATETVACQLHRKALTDVVLTELAALEVSG